MNKYTKDKETSRRLIQQLENIAGVLGDESVKAVTLKSESHMQNAMIKIHEAINELEEIILNTR